MMRRTPLKRTGFKPRAHADVGGVYTMKKTFATKSEPRPLIKGERLMLTGITVPSGATKDTRVWVVNRFHNRITTRKIGGDIIRFGSFPPDIVSVTATKGEAIKAMLECRAAELNNAMREMARAERAMASALKLASKEGAC